MGWPKIASQIIGVSASLIIIYAGYCLLRPLDIHYQFSPPSFPPNQPLKLDKQMVSRGAIGFIDPHQKTINCRPVGSEATTEQPTASIAKLITVQVVLAKEPLLPNHDGEKITLTSDDEYLYQQEIARNGSSLAVKAGDVFSYRQMLQAILLASANNIADSLAIKTFGSLDNYQKTANEWLAEHNLNSTHVGTDASGYDPSTTSTALDICQIMGLATQNPVIREIASMSKADMPNSKTIKNTNRLIGKSGVYAGKTGFTETAGHGVTVASQIIVAKRPVDIVATSLHNDTYPDAFNAVSGLLETTQANLSSLDLNGLIIAQAPWAKPIAVNPQQSAAAYYWADQPPKVSFSISRQAKINQLGENTLVGNITVNNNQFALMSTGQIKPAALSWRLTHPF